MLQFRRELVHAYCSKCNILSRLDQWTIERIRPRTGWIGQGYTVFRDGLI